MKLREIAYLLGGEVRGEPDLEIKGVAGLEDAAKGDISYIADTKSIKSISRARKSRASCVLVKEFNAELEVSQVQVENPQYAFAVLLERFHEVPRPPAGVHDLAFVADGATVSHDASIGAFAYISDGASVGARTVIYPGVFVGEDSAIGEDCLVYPNVIIRDGVTIGSRVILQPGAVIGADGFSYVMHEGKHHKIPQVGGVIIGDDVEVGACTTIDRATTGNTLIGNGTKIDNLVQVAHNVSVGENAVLVSQVGIGGSSRIGNSVVLGGQAGVADHVNIADGTMLAGRSGVISDLKRGVYSGMPAVPRREFMRAMSFLYKIPEINDRIKQLEEKLGNIERSRGDD